MTNTADIYSGEEYLGDIPNVPQELRNHTAAKAGRLVDERDIEGLSDQVRAERAGAIMVSIAQEHFEVNPESEYIDFLQHPEFEKIRLLLVKGQTDSVGGRFDDLREFIEAQGFSLIRPSYQYFMDLYEKSCPDFFGICRYPKGSSEHNSLRFSSQEKKDAVKSNRNAFKNRKAA